MESQHQLLHSSTSGADPGLIQDNGSPGSSP